MAPSDDEYNPPRVQTRVRVKNKRERGYDLHRARVKLRVKAKQEHRCDFCRSRIGAGESYIKTMIKDRFGRFTLHYHEHCDRTAELNALVGWEGA